METNFLEGHKLTAENQGDLEKAIDDAGIRPRVEALKAFLNTELTQKGYKIEHRIFYLASFFDDPSRVHLNSIHLGRVTSRIGRELVGTSPELAKVVWAAVIHDFGKHTIPHHLLDKTGKLTPDEYKIVQAHAAAGFYILQSIQDMSDIAQKLFL